MSTKTKPRKKRIKLTPTQQIRKAMQWPNKAFGQTDFNERCEPELIHVLLDHIDRLEARIVMLEGNKNG